MPLKSLFDSWKLSTDCISEINNRQADNSSDGNSQFINL